ncbi:MAG: PHP domain-containing protein [Clostridia bacterium]|nr:PHP domain-containing protein [Clostridia bacterium]
MNDLKRELINAYPYLYELHAHTRPVSPCSDIPPAELVQRYHALGAHGIVITNHAFDRLADAVGDDWVEQYLRDYREAKAQGGQLGIQVLLGMEIRFPQNDNDYLIYGIDEEFVQQVRPYFYGDLHAFYQDWAAPDRVIVQAHPFRDGMERANMADLDGVEVFNQHPGHNSRTSLAARHHAEHGGVVTGGTDFHHRGHEGQVFTCFKELPKDSFHLARLLKSGDYIFRIGDSVILP